MHTYNQAFFELKNKLQALYDEREAVAIAHEVLLNITGHDKLERLMQKDNELSIAQHEQYASATQDLLKGKPLQYITHSAWFMGREYFVDERVLIPRPETEELVQWIIDDHKNNELQILDIGTGSGCIPISLKLAMPGNKITSCDISSAALDVAKQNAEKLQAEVLFTRADFLNTEVQEEFGIYDIIVSNPPYIPVSKKETMHTNVRDHEPEIALFVPANDPLLFYRSIAIFGKGHLARGGSIYCEVEVDHAHECRALFEDIGYAHVEIKKDMHGNWRMLKGRK